eukprot:CAMPEP_0174945018 /NCGR_PEP_ID=MMETSP1355-20121228/80550_1 /TAXON_ID=464990 /ORGANISM="Hemiselmis tepida, Strain CCMP443" /LENGTH=147 /DNA_ID=CAMNT_0016192369 /DNA_START=380 /DNA_END=819 /DNA_ORIENTATION=+
MLAEYAHQECALRIKGVRARGWRPHLIQKSALLHRNVLHPEPKAVLAVPALVHVLRPPFLFAPCAMDSLLCTHSLPPVVVGHMCIAGQGTSPRAAFAGSRILRGGGSCASCVWNLGRNGRLCAGGIALPCALLSPSHPSTTPALLPA